MAFDPRFDSNARRLENLNALIEEIEKITRTKGKFQLEKLLAGNNVPCGAVMTIPEVMLTRHTQDSGMLQVMDQALIGKLFTTGIPMHFNKTPGAIRRASPLLGEHSVEILKEAGFADHAIDELVKNEIVETYAG